MSRATSRVAETIRSQIRSPQLGAAPTCFPSLWGWDGILDVMVSWKDIEAAEPAFAKRVRSTFAIRKHATLATLRRDGSPRISGTDVQFGDDGEIYLGMMPRSVKALDLRRDPRVALHCPTEDTPEDNTSSWLGEGKLAGFAVEIPGPDESHRFRIDITEVVLTAVGTPADHLVIQSWHPGRGLERQERR
jgi:hypothetical protein